MAATKQKYRKTSKGKLVVQKGLRERIAQIEQSMVRSDFPEYHPGDTVRVHVRIKEGEKERIQIYEGIVIAQSNRGVNRSFTVRKVSHGVGVERIFLESSPKIAKLEIAQEGKVRRAKLYYLRGLEGKAARVERNITTVASATASATARASKPTQG
jgi:large subunit ribosomal protein L19